MPKQWAEPLHFLAITLSIGVLAYTPSPALAITSISTNAGFAYLVDTETDIVLVDHNSTKRMYPASMTKIMTAYVAFLAIKQGVLQLDDPIHISRKAHRYGGSKMFLREDDQVPVRDILRGIIIQSGNDASVALAEHIGGDEATFAGIMNETAQKLGMFETNFVNASGWPDENHYTTAKDLAILSERMIEDFPELYAMFSEKTFTFSGITQKNRNVLLGDSGIDGVKTGHTEASGYGQVTSAEIDGRRILLVINGLDSARKRSSESLKLINWAFRSTKTLNFYQAGDTVGEIPLWYGEENALSLYTQQDVLMTLSNAQAQLIKQTVTYEKPLKAPISADQEVAQLHIHDDQEVLLQIPLYAKQSIDSKGFFAKFQSNIQYLLYGTTP